MSDENRIAELDRLVNDIVATDDPDLVYAAIDAVVDIGTLAAAIALVGVLGYLFESEWEDTEPYVAEYAIAALGRIRHPDMLVPLLGLLDTFAADPFIPDYIYAAIGTLGDERAVEPLLARVVLSMVANQEPLFRTLGELASERAWAPLTELAQGDYSTVRLFTVQALAGYGVRAVPLLIERLAAETNDETQSRIIEVLGELGDWRAVEPLYTFMTTSNAARWARGDYNDRQRMAGIALARLGDARGFDAVVDATGAISLSVALSAIWALVALGDRRAVPHLQALLDDKSRLVRRRAAEALEALGDE